MKAAILVELNQPLVVADIEPASPLSFGQVLVKVHYSGICGAQLNEIDGAKGPDKFLPHLLGHEGSATVLEVGPGVRTVKTGDRVVMHWRPSDGLQCDPPAYTWDGRKVNAGWVTTFNDHAIVSENRVTKIADDLDLRVAPLLGCAVTTATGVINRDAGVQIGQSVVVIGAGGVGINLVQAAQLVSANPIVAIDKVDVEARLGEEVRRHAHARRGSGRDARVAHPRHRRRQRRRRRDRYDRQRACDRDGVRRDARRREDHPRGRARRRATTSRSTRCRCISKRC